MAFEGFVIARQVVILVEELATCKMQLEEVERKGDWVFDKLEAVTIDLGDIASKLFKHSMNAAGEGKDIYSQPTSASPNLLDLTRLAKPDNLITACHEMEQIDGKIEEDGQHGGKAARLCRDGASCNYAWRGKCVFYHPGAGKSRETVIKIIQSLTMINLGVPSIFLFG